MAEEKQKENPEAEKPKETKTTKKNVNYVHAALLLHSAGKKVDEASMKKVIEATGISADPAQIKALVTSLEGVNIDEAIRQSVFTAAPAAAPAEEKKEEKKEEKSDEKKAEEAAAGLSSLFG